MVCDGRVEVHCTIVYFCVCLKFSISKEVFKKEFSQYKTFRHCWKQLKYFHAQRLWPRHLCGNSDNWLEGRKTCKVCARLGLPCMW
jgi:hypothetical protein